MMLPKRVVIMIRIVEIHMNPSLYPNPEEFNPENFSPEAIRTRSKYAHLPHSSGIRDCIGEEYFIGHFILIKLYHVNL